MATLQSNKETPRFHFNPWRDSNSNNPSPSTSPKSNGWILGSTLYLNPSIHVRYHGGNKSTRLYINQARKKGMLFTHHIYQSLEKKILIQRASVMGHLACLKVERKRKGKIRERSVGTWRKERGKWILEGDFGSNADGYVLLLWMLWFFDMMDREDGSRYEG